MRELTGGANNTPNDGGSTKHLSAWANEAILLFGIAHISDVCEHPCLNTELYCSGDDRGNNLCPEHWAGADGGKGENKEVRKRVVTYGIFM